MQVVTHVSPEANPTQGELMLGLEVTQTASTTGAPMVDIIIPCYKQGRYLAQAIESVLAQAYPHVGVIVVDDGSPDQTAAVAARYGDRIRYIRQENSGVAVARNAGLLASSAEFVLFLDADDYLHPEAVEKHIEAARAVPTGSVFHSTCQHVDETGRYLARIEARPLGEDVFHSLLTGNRFEPLSVMIRRSVFSRVGLFDGTLNGAEDWDMWLRLGAAGCEFVAVPEAISMYRQHSSNVSKNSLRSWQAGLKVLRKSETHHGDCALCRRARRCGTRRLQNWCFDLLTRQMDMALSQGEFRTGLALAVRSPIGRTARLALPATKEFCVYTLRAAVRTVRRPPVKRPRVFGHRQPDAGGS